MPAAAKAAIIALVPLLTVSTCFTPSFFASWVSNRVVKPFSPPRYRSSCPLAITRPTLSHSLTPSVCTAVPSLILLGVLEHAGDDSVAPDRSYPIVPKRPLILNSSSFYEQRVGDL